MSTPVGRPTAIVLGRDATQLIMLAGLLNQADTEPRLFADIKAALSVLRSIPPPDLVVINGEMGTDAGRFCRRLRSMQQSELHVTPILLVVSGQPAAQVEGLTLATRADAVIPLPVPAGTFVNQVRALLRVSAYG